MKNCCYSGETIFYLLVRSPSQYDSVTNSQYLIFLHRISLKVAYFHFYLIDKKEKKIKLVNVYHGNISPSGVTILSVRFITSF